MSVVTIFSGKFCQGEEVASHLACELDYRLLSDNDVVKSSAERCDIDSDDLAETIVPHRSLLRGRTRDKRLGVAYLREGIAQLGAQDNIVHHGLTGHLLASSISHVLKVCLVAKMEHRIAVASETKGLTQRAARKEIRRHDLELAEWTNYLFERGPWDKTLYDLKLPMHEHDIAQAVATIANHVQSDVIRTTDASRRAWADFTVAAGLNAVLVKEGHDVAVSATAGEVTITVNKYAVRFEALRKRLEDSAMQFEGVVGVKVIPGRGFRTGYLADDEQFALPAKVLLVDDEEEYVQTLSERLRIRDIGTTTVYSGEGALQAIEEDEPEVIVLDLRMPGIDGMEVLRRVKQKRSHVEVIVLTGHGSEKDRALADELGAFAYLEKPVSIERLTETLRQAHEKIQRNRQESAGSEE